jgi:hypothetical protein
VLLKDKDQLEEIEDSVPKEDSTVKVDSVAKVDSDVIETTLEIQETQP